MIFPRCLVLAVLCFSILLTGCTTHYPNKMLDGAFFPRVSGQNLEEQTVVFPDSVAGKKTLLLLGYVQNSQFDIDRWLIGIDMTQTEIDAYELPAIQGMFPRFFKTQINQGMRNGIPKALWKGVVTIYKQGEALQKFTGNINPNNARVVLLDSQGKIIFFYDAGFSVDALNKLREKIKQKDKVS